MTLGILRQSLSQASIGSIIRARLACPGRGFVLWNAGQTLAMYRRQVSTARPGDSSTITTPTASRQTRRVTVG